VRIRTANVAIIAVAVVLAVMDRPAAAKTHPTEVTLYMKSGKCDHKVDRDKLSLKRPKDVAILEIHNDAEGSEQCSGQDVVLCSYFKGQPSGILFEGCVSTPVSGVVLNATFTVKPGDVLRLMCLGKLAAAFNQGNTILIDNGNTGNPPECPKALTERPSASDGEPRYHKIDIEIVP
jgi:hypothetical protein